MQIFTAFVWKIICNSAGCKPRWLSEWLQWKGGLRSLHRNVKTRSVHHWIKTRARSQPGQHIQSSSNSSNTFATVSKQLQQWKKRLLQYSAAGWNQIRLRCVSVRSSCSGGEGAVSVVARKFPEKIRSIYFLKVSRRQVSGCCRPAVKEVIVPQNPFLHLPLLLLRADLKLGPRFCTPLVKLW